jgi:DNA-binding XRE family transcriptional regulator
MVRARPSEFQTRPRLAMSLYAIAKLFGEPIEKIFSADD